MKGRTGGVGEGPMMKSGPGGATIRQLGELFEGGSVAGLGEVQLLDRFVARRDEPAFAALVARHGPMVLGVCRRALSDPGDVEDAFQATFLVLVRRSHSVHVQDSLGRWPYGVARRVASRARKAARRRMVLAIPPPDDLAARPGDPSDQSELSTVLDEELARLPAKYRLPLVMCYLEGLSNEDAARRLGCPLGTIQSRLSRGRDRLRARLRRRGLASSGTFPLACMGPHAVRHAASGALVEKTTRNAMHLAAARASGTVGLPTSTLNLVEGVLKAMALDWLRSAAVIVLLIATTYTAAAALHGGDGRGP